MRHLEFANVRLTSVGAAAFAALLATVACSDTSSSGQLPVSARGDEQSGELGLSLQLASGQSVSSVSYTIIGPNGFSKVGTIDVSSSSAIAATIGSLPAGSGFSIALSATSSDGQAQCSGSASFTVIAHQTTPVAVSLLCHQGARTGSVLVNGVVNVCPTLDGVNAAPAEVVVGSSLALNAIAHDSDAGPAALVYNWTTSSGSLSDAHSPTPTFTCTSAGPATLTVSVADGDLAANCADLGSVAVFCSIAGGSSGTGGTGGSSSGGASGAGGAGASGAGAGGAGASGAGAGGAGASGAGAGGASAAGAGAGGAGASGAAGSSSASNLVVYRVGDGGGALANTGNPVFVDEFTSAGTLVRSSGMPGSGHRLVASGVATSEGFITRSTNGKYVLLTGYDSALPASASLAGTTSAAVPRTIGRLDSTGAVDTTTGLSDAATGNNPRSAASTDGVNLWLTGGAGGIRFTTLGASTSVQLSTTVVNLRQVGIFGAQLFVSDASGSAVRLGPVGVGLPTTSGQTITNLPGIPTSTGSPYGFFLADLDSNTPGLDVAYVADDGAGLLKYSLLGSTWTANGTLGTAADAYRGLTGVVSGSSVTLYATRKGGSTATGGGELVQVIDAAGFNGALTATPTLLATAAVNTAFRGVALAPQP
ncbi:MAG: hypothetical protein ABW061_18975 [Polyangiaceae bacterium]